MSIRRYLRPWFLKRKLKRLVRKFVWAEQCFGYREPGCDLRHKELLGDAEFRVLLVGEDKIKWQLVPVWARMYYIVKRGCVGYYVYPPE